MSDMDEIRQQAERIRASGLLGKPGTLSRLFDYLLERSLIAEVAKETEIALTVFGKSINLNAPQDSVVRVTVHKLRRRLEDFYNHAPSQTTSRIVIPKGEYRLAIERTPFNEPEAQAPEPPTAPKSADVVHPWRRRVASGATLLITAMVGAVIAIMAVTDRRDWDMRAVRNSAVWGPLLADDLPITIVVGDYYLLGETDPNGDVARLVREFSINSPDDFMTQMEANPDLMARYRNLQLTYLPTASAFALQDLVPMLSTKKRVRIMLMSDMNGNVLRNTHIVYIGYISGLGLLSDPVFNASRMMPGDSYDVLIDTTTNEGYYSSAADVGESRYTDYGYFATFPGPAHNRIVVIAGTRDTGVMTVAETVLRPAALDELKKKAGAATSFESLYEVYGVAKAGMNTRQVFVAPLATTHIWE